MDFRQLRLIWLALMGGVATYTLVVVGLVGTGAIDMGLIAAPVVRLAAMAVLVYMFAGIPLRRAMLTRIPPDAEPERRLALYRGATLVGLGLIESGGLMIITLGMLASSPRWVLVGGASAVAMMIAARPRAVEVGIDG